MSTARADLRSALADILDDFRVANTTLLRQTHRARPATFHPPLAYVGPFSEPTITHEFANRQRREIRASLVLVQGVYENAETVDKLDVLADALLAFLVSRHADAGATRLLEAISSEDVELTIGEATYAATAVSMSLDVVD